MVAFFLGERFPGRLTEPALLKGIQLPGAVAGAPGPDPASGHVETRYRASIVFRQPPQR